MKISSVSEGTDIPLLPNHLHHRGNHPLDCPNSTLAVKNIYILPLRLVCLKEQMMPTQAALLHSDSPSISMQIPHGE